MKSNRVQSKQRWEQTLRFGFGVLLVVTCLRVWLSGPPVLPQARAQLPNPAAQRLEAIREARRTNELLTEIRDLLKKGTLHVRVVGADNPSDAPIGPRRADR